MNHGIEFPVRMPRSRLSCGAEVPMHSVSRQSWSWKWQSLRLDSENAVKWAVHQILDQSKAITSHLIIIRVMGQGGTSDKCTSVRHKRQVNCLQKTDVVLHAAHWQRTDL